MQSLYQSRRKWLLLAGVIVLFLVVIDLLESLVGQDSPPSESESAPQGDGVAARSPRPPEVLRLDEGGIEIRHDFFRRTTIRLSDADEETALFDCLVQGVEATFVHDGESWSRRRVRHETQRIQDECMGSATDLPIPPRLPRSED